MELWAAPYLIPYLLLFLFWLLAIHRQILFWLYLWQLKEYHLGRFLAHFETAKGKSLFLNPLFFAKIALLIFGAAGFIYGTLMLPFAAAVLLVMGLQALHAAYGIARMNLLHPVVTKKSFLLIAAAHLLAFAWAIFIFNRFLGEMSLPDFALAAILLLITDILMPAWVSLIVLLFQPLTVWQKKIILAKTAAIIGRRADLTTIGITGSYGKSATKDLLALILSKKYAVLKTQANQNTEIGVAQAIINELKPEHKFFVGEIGAVHKGKIKEIANVVKPRIGILTGINLQHLGIFGSQQNIIDAKFEMLEALPENGTAILNWQSNLVKESFEGQKSKIKAKNMFFAGKDVGVSNIKADKRGLLFDINYKNKKALLITNARGAYMVEPILLAVAGALAVGMDFDEISKIVNTIDFTLFGIKVRKNSLGQNIIESTYSSNPDGVVVHLDYLTLWPGEAVSREVPSKPRGKKAIIMPCLIELGGESKNIHYKIGEKIGKVCDLAIITTKDRFGDIKRGALSCNDQIIAKGNIVFCDNPAKISELIKNRLSDGGTILLEGRLPQAIIDLLR